MRFTMNCPLWAPVWEHCEGLSQEAKSNSGAVIRWSEVHTSEFCVWAARVWMEEVKESHQEHTCHSRCSVNICGCDPLTLEISWGSELRINSKDSPFLLWVTEESGSFLPTSCSAHHWWRPDCSSVSGTSCGRTYLMSSWHWRRKWKMGLSETAFA